MADYFCTFCGRRHEPLDHCPRQTRQTTILGTVYTGRPMIGSYALSIWQMEQDGNVDGARALLDSLNRVARTFGAPDYDIAAHMTDLPQEGSTITPAR